MIRYFEEREAIFSRKYQTLCEKNLKYRQKVKSLEERLEDLEIHLKLKKSEFEAIVKFTKESHEMIRIVF